MLTIGQLAAYAGVTVRAVRHYHAKGLLREPERDHSGYRRYDAAAVVGLIKIRILADAGVPLARVKGLLAADEEEFAAAVADIDDRLLAEIRLRQQHRKRIARIAAGESIALPPEAVAYLRRCRELGFPEQMIELERDSWIVVAAQLPDQVPTLMGFKRAQLEDPELIALYQILGEAIDWRPEDRRWPGIVDRLVTYFEQVEERYSEVPVEWQHEELDASLIALLDEMFVEAVPGARRVMRLLEERGFTGWTNLRRTDRGSSPPARTAQ